MATREQVNMIFELIKDSHKDSHSDNFFKRINETNRGIAALLGHLNDDDVPVTAGQISRFMNVSTARVAVLLKKMEARGFIVKETDENDARKTVVVLSELGKKKAEELHDDMCSQISEMIDRIGMERLVDFIAVSKEIRSIMKGPPADIIDKE